VAANDLLGNKTIVDISKKYGKTPSQIILSWVLGQGASVVPKARSRQHLSENIDVFDFELSSEEMQSIDRLNTGNSHRYFR
jgi:diketogulonate reductase-like aldo/keto reductase